MFGAMVGAAGYVQHYSGIRKGGPNAYLKINPEKGPNDNFMELVVKTRNNQGIQDRNLYGPHRPTCENHDSSSQP